MTTQSGPAPIAAPHCAEWRALRTLDLFSGIGGITLGLESTGGFQTVAFCEIDQFCREVLRAHWPEVPCHDDVRKLSAQSVGPVDAIVGGFPCQPHSVAGKRKGREDERHLWPEFARLVREIRPRWVLAENVPGIRSTAADEVLADLEAAGYSCWPLVVGADDVGAPHRRKRVWFVAHRAGARRDEWGPESVGGDGRSTPQTARPAERGALADCDGAALRQLPGRSGGPRGASEAESRGDGAALADSDQPGLGAVRSSVLLDGERETRRDDAHGRGGGPVGSPTGGGLAGARGSDAGPLATTPAQRWPARPGEPQHEWEEPRLAYGEGESLRRAGQSREGTDQGRPEQPLGAAAHGLPLDLVQRLADRSGMARADVAEWWARNHFKVERRQNREALKAAGNSVVPQVVRAIGLAILAADRELSQTPD